MSYGQGAERTGPARRGGEVWFAKETIAQLVAGAAARRDAVGQVEPDTREAIQARMNEARTRLS